MNTVIFVLMALTTGAILGGVFWIGNAVTAIWKGKK